MDQSLPAPVELRLDARTEGTVVWVIIRNEAKLNVLNTRVLDALIDSFTRLGDDSALRAAVLTGGGTRAFIGGADIDEMAGLDERSAVTFISRVHGVCQAIRDLPVPVIGRINGFALGGGMEVAAACDMRIVARSARFGMPEVRLGIPSVIEAALLPGLIGFGRARRLVLLGDVVGAEEIADWGFCDELVDDADLDAMVERYLSALLECGPNALRLQKELVRRWEDLPLSQAVAAGIETFGRAFKSDEPHRLMRAFQARRKARRG
jgi:enoyl-CoA hydratase/carnithine racemase